MKKFFLSSSILSADFAQLGKDVTAVLEAGSDMIHFDVMDNHYVPNLTIGPLVLESLQNYKIKSVIDVHLMVRPVDDLIMKFLKLGVDIISFHPESTDHVDRAITLIKDFGCKVGLAFNPSTSLEILNYVIDKIDIVLLMSVNPGFSGQIFLSSTLNKIRQTRKLIDARNKNVLLAVDGGVNVNNIFEIASLGVDIFVLGTAIFKSSNYRLSIQSIRNILDKVTN